MKSSRSSVSGFTMTELMVVVVIAAILAALAVPSFKSLTQSQQVRNATFDLYAGLIVARSEAIKRNADVTITPVDYAVANPTPHNEKGWTITTVLADGTTLTIQNQSQLKGVALTPNPDNTPWVTYRRTGRLAAAAAPVFTIDAYGETTVHARCIRIDLSGMPRIYKPTGGNC
jgi:type IV fimbrial biogenesis protein FimT